MQRPTRRHIEELRTISSRDPRAIRRRLLEGLRAVTQADFCFCWGIADVDGRPYHTSVEVVGYRAIEEGLRGLLDGRPQLGTSSFDLRRPSAQDTRAFRAQAEII